MNRYLITLLIAAAGIPAHAASQDDCIKLGITVSQIARIVRDGEGEDGAAKEFVDGVKSSKDKAARQLTLALIAEIKKSDKSAVELSSNAIRNCLAGK